MMEKERLKKVSDILLFFENTVKTVKLYPPGTPHCEEFIERLHGHLEEILAAGYPLRLVVDRFTLTTDGEPIYTNEDQTESLAFVMYRDGLRELTLRPGLTPAETREIVGAFNRDFTLEYLDEDIATYFWERELPHLGYVVSEEYLDQDIPSEMKDFNRLSDSLKRHLVKEGAAAPAGVAEGGRASIPLRQPFITPDRLTLSPQEMQSLEEARERDSREIFFDEMLTIVLSILYQETDEESIASFLGLLDEILESLLGAGELGHAAFLLEKIRAADAGEERLSPAAAERIARFYSQTGAERHITRLGAAIEEGRATDPDALDHIVSLLHPAAVPHLIALFETLTSIKTRRSLCAALAHLGPEPLPFLVEGLRDSRWFVVRNVVYTLGLMKDIDTVSYVAPLAAHEDRRVRKEVLRALAAAGTPAAAAAIAAALDHPDESTRRQALRSLPRRPDETLSRDLLALTATAAFASRSPREKEETFRALGSVSTDALIPRLEERLGGTRWFRSRREKEARALAAAALDALGTPAARKRLAALGGGALKPRAGGREPRRGEQKERRRGR